MKKLIAFVLGLILSVPAFAANDCTTTTSENIFTTENNTEGFFNSVGEYTSSHVNVRTTDYLELPTTATVLTYSFSAGETMAVPSIAFFNSSKQAISYYKMDGQQSVNIDIPANTKYVRIPYRTTNSNHVVTYTYCAQPANSGPISSVTVSGLVAQNGTPTPNTPVAINTNNGVLKASKNLFDGQWEYGNIESSGPTGHATQYVRSVNFIPVSPSTQYMLSTNNEAALGYEPQFYTLEYDSSKKFIANTRIQRNNVVRTTKGSLMTTTASTAYIKVFYYSASKNYTTDTSQFNFQIEKGSIKTEYHPYGEVYVDGTVETIEDSANHTANVATLLGIGDYKDTQNINTGAITRNVGVKVLDGTEEWSASTAYGGSFFIPGAMTSWGAVGGENNLCTHFSRTVFNISNKHFYVVSSAFNDATAFRQFLADQYANGTPVVIIYPLATVTNESVTAQTLTTAPVSNATGGVSGMTIRTVLTSGAEIIETIADKIKIATTKYNAARFDPLVQTLNSAIAKIKDVVSTTIEQTKAVADLHSGKQQRPSDTACPDYRQCLLVEDNNGVPHWYEIMDPFYNLFSAVIPNNVSTDSVTSQNAVPSTYTQLEYIESTGTQYIDTGIYPSSDTNIELDAMLNAVSLGNSFIFGSYETNKKYAINLYTDQYIYVRYGQTSSSGLTKYPLNEVFKLKITNGLCYMNDNVIADYSSDSFGQSNITLYLLANNGFAGNNIKGKLYNTKIWNSNTLVRDFVPVRRNSDQRVGMYDLVTGNFYGNAESQTVNFAAGPVVPNQKASWAMTFGANAPLDVRYGVTGTAVCNATSGTANTAATSTQMSNANWTASGNYCWCSIDSVTDQNGNSSVGKNIWVWLAVPSGETCAGDCAENCATTVQSGTNTAFRHAMTGI